MVRTKTEPRYILALKCLYKEEIVMSKVEKQIRREIEIQSNLRFAPRISFLTLVTYGYPMRHKLQSPEHTSALWVLP
jgi:hypothetical protein